MFRVTINWFYFTRGWEKKILGYFFLVHVSIFLATAIQSFRFLIAEYCGPCLGYLLAAHPSVFSLSLARTHALVNTLSLSHSLTHKGSPSTKIDYGSSQRLQKDAVGLSPVNFLISAASKVPQTWIQSASLVWGPSVTLINIVSTFKLEKNLMISNCILVPCGGLVQSRVGLRWRGPLFNSYYLQTLFRS